MVPRADVQSFVDRVAARFKPLRVILFVSHAYGKPTADFDVELPVVTLHTGRAANAAGLIRFT